MKRLTAALLLLASLPFACKQVPVRTTVADQRNVVHGVRLSDNYSTYLDQIIELKQKFPISTVEVLRFPIKVHVVNPLIGTSLHEEDFSAGLQYLNAHFKASGIQFDFVNEGNNYIYSEQNVDYFYQNASVEKFFTEKTYDKTVINLYIFDNYEDVVGYTHYPVLNLNRIFISKAHLTDPSFIHEMGHFFGLLHTFEKDITRSSLANNEDCQKNGDKVCDTPPDPFGASFIEGECNLFGEYKDRYGKHFNPDMSNFMSYYGSCRTRFTPQQQELMYYIAKMIKYPQMRVRV